MKILGIDEAGRGSFLGPMVIAGACIDECNLKYLKDLGVKDSKLLSPRQRENIFEIIDVDQPRIVDYVGHVIAPHIIDEKNLNTIELESFKTLIRIFNPDKVIIDSPVNPSGYDKFVDRLDISDNIELVLENKADVNYPIVGMASIIAKVMRDREIDRLNEQFGVGFSGYPSDHKTVEFVRSNFDNVDLQPHIRHSWGTYALLLKERRI